MAHLVFCALCHKAVTDKDSNQLSVLDVFEHVKVEARTKLTSVGLLPLSAQFAMVWTRSSLDQGEKAQARLKIMTPTNTELATKLYEIDLEARPNYRVIMKLQGLPISESGRYWFVVECEESDGIWSVRGRFPLDIEISVKPEPAESAPES